jgi:hypothetical protein
MNRYLSPGARINQSYDTDNRKTEYDTKFEIPNLSDVTNFDSERKLKYGEHRTDRKTRRQRRNFEVAESGFKLTRRQIVSRVDFTNNEECDVDTR